MAKKKSYLTVTDQFCGCGGSSSGAKKVLDRRGGEISLALNHWKLAIETHNTNFPDTLHDCTDVSACDPRRYPSTDILITSPECTTHSPAGGNRKVLKKQMAMFNSGKIDAAAERSRATMWDVCRFAEYHCYNIIIVENVVEARNWALFDTWLLAMHNLGYNHKCVYHNSMHHMPTPQSRDRMYIVFWKKGNRAPDLDLTPAAYCVKCEKNVEAVQTWKRTDRQFGKYDKQYVYCCPLCATIVSPYYYAAFNCIDWSDPGTRISDREKPLSPKTLARIQHGLDKYGSQPIQIQTNYGPEARGTSKSIFAAGYTQTTQPSTAFVLKDGIPMPFILKLEHSNKPVVVGSAFATQCARQTQMIIRPLPTQTTTQGLAFAVPFLINRNIGGSARAILDPINTVTANGVKSAIITTPFLTESYGTGKSRGVDKEINTVTAGGVKTGIVTTDSWNAFIQAYYGGSIVQSSPVDSINSMNTHERHYLVKYQNPKLEDCYYRMLKPPEIKLAMAFENDYIVLGNNRDQVKQLGNAVTPPAMEWLVDRCISSLN